MRAQQIHQSGERTGVTTSCRSKQVPGVPQEAPTCSPRPSCVGKNGPSSDMKPPPMDEQPGPLYGRCTVYRICSLTVVIVMSNVYSNRRPCPLAWRPTVPYATGTRTKASGRRPPFATAGWPDAG